MWECQLKSCALAYSLWERERKRLAEAFISGLTLSVVQCLGSSLESVGYWVEGENPQPNVCCERGKRQEERERCWLAGSGDPWRPAAHDDPFEDQARVAAAGAGIHFWCVGGLCVTHLSRSGLVSCTWGWDDFCRGYLGRMWRQPWQSASVQTTLTHLLSWMPQELCTEICSCLALQTQLYSSYKSRTTLKNLIGISPNCSIYFVSELWSGPISACELVIKSGMFSLSKKIYHHIHKQCYPSTFLFFYFLTTFICCLLIRMIASQASCFVLQKKKILINAFTLIVLFQSPFFLTSFVFADSDGWFTSIMFSFKKLFRHIHEHCCYLSLFCFSDTFGFLVNGSWSHDKLSAPYFVPCCTENISIIEIDHSLHCYHWMHFIKRLWEKVPTTTNQA